MFNMINAILTYSTGYAHFLRNNPSGGVYVFLLGLASIGVVTKDFLYDILNEFNSRFRIVTHPEKTLESDDEEEDEYEDSEEQEQEGPQPSEQEQEAPQPSEQEQEASQPAEQETHTKTE